MVNRLVTDRLLAKGFWRMNSVLEPSPTISLVLIVRDEAENLAQLLREMAPLYDEAVVVDTGSTDRSAQVAAEAGARVVNFKWCDDFAAARNHGIDNAGGDWILTIDADERLAAEDFPTLRNAIACKTDQCFILTQRNYTDLTGLPEWRPVNGRYPEQENGLNGYTEACQVRLFPRLPGVRYHGCIHETVKGCAGAGLRRTFLEVTIHHYGHIRDGEVALRRADLYTRLTREKLRRNPDDGDACLQMATRYLEERQTEKARQLLQRLVETGAPTDPTVARGHLALGRILKVTGNPAEALSEFEQAIQQKPEWIFCWVEMISALAGANRWSDMALYLKEAKALFPEEPKFWQLECRLMVAIGEYSDAAILADKLFTHFPNWQAANRLAYLCQKLVARQSACQQGIMELEQAAR